MRRLLCALLLAAVLPSCTSQPTHAVTTDVTGEMGGTFGETPHDVLYVDPGSAQASRAAFVTGLRKFSSRDPGLEALYSSFITSIGANGILDGIAQVWPQCHDEAHPLGRIIERTVSDIGTALRVCGGGCNSGCMHGVLMEAFAGARNPNDPAGHVDAAKVRTMMNDLCAKNAVMTSAYSPGDCAHGVGHALMVLADNRIPEAIASCDAFSSAAMRYYCATGAYMQYVTDNDQRDAAARGPLYPCDIGIKYPAACARYKMTYVVPRMVHWPSDLPAIYALCRELRGAYRLACFHGLGNAFGGPIRDGQIGLMGICGELGMTPDERTVCIEGAMERIAKYDKPGAERVCTAVEGPDRSVCDRAVRQGMYNMHADLRLYE